MGKVALDGKASNRESMARDPAMTITTIALDADDTLWQNEQFIRLTEQRFADLLRPYADRRTCRTPDRRDHRNLDFYGYGMKGFTLSMVETALDVTDHRVPGTVIAELLAAGRELLSYPIETLPYVDQALSQLQHSHRLILITKGDVIDQERKLAASGLPIISPPSKSSPTRHPPSIPASLQSYRWRRAHRHGRQLAALRHSACARGRQLRRLRAA